MLASLRFRILAAVALALVLASFIGGQQARSSAEKLAQNLQDQNLRAMAFGFFSSVTASQGSWVAPEELAGFIPADVDQYFYRLLGPQGSYISGYNFVRVPVPEETEPGKPYFATWTDGSDGTFRGVSIRAFVEQTEAPGWVTLQVAQSTRGAEKLVGDRMRSYYSTAALIGFGALLSAAIILSTIFRPLSSLTRSVERRSAEDLSAIQQEVPVEVQPLKNRLNALFEKVRTEQDAKDRLISNVAHQLRTPLTTIRLRANLALNAEEPQPHLEALDREAVRAATMAHQLLQLEGQGPEVIAQGFALNQSLKSFVEDWQPNFDRAKVDLRFEPHPANPKIAANPALIEEIVSNLLNNALVHAEAKTVWLRIYEDGFEVQDNGKGVSRDQLPWLAERFFTGDAENKGGHGLGLSIATDYAQRMGACLDLRNDSGLSVRYRVQAS